MTKLWRASQRKIMLPFYIDEINLYHKKAIFRFLIKSEKLPFFKLAYRIHI